MASPKIIEGQVALTNQQAETDVVVAEVCFNGYLIIELFDYTGR